MASCARLKAAVYGEGHAMLEAEFAGTHIGAFEGIPASSRQVRVPYAVAYDVRAGGIAALRLYFPLEQLLQQIRGEREPTGAGARTS